MATAHEPSGVARAPATALADGTPFHAAPGVDVAERVGSRAEGLKSAEVEAARARWGDNRIAAKTRAPWRVFVEQFQSVLVYILLVALALSLVAPWFESEAPTLSHFTDAIVIGAILLLNAALGFVQEFRAERAVAALQARESAPTHVRRDGGIVTVPSGELVVGDILVLEAGARVPADARLLEAHFLHVDESVVTGESVPVEKDARPCEAELRADQRSMLFAGGLLTRGNAVAVVTATGEHSETGRMATLVASGTTAPTPLQRQLARLGRLLGAVALGMCAVVLAVGIARGLDWLEMANIALSLAVSAVPEGLPASVTLCFALGVARMARHQALVRRLSSLETLGRVTVVCTDKTGTITTNQMTVVETWSPDPDALAACFASCNHAHDEARGEPTELAILRWASARSAPRHDIEEELVPFSSEAKYMRTRHRDATGAVEYIKGSLERVTDLCEGRVPPEALKAAERMANSALRILAGAEDRGDGLRFLGFVGMEDPPREGVREAIADAARAGIRTVMITGDHGSTARAIAAKVGLEGPLVTGAELETASEADLAELVQRTAIFSRVSPAHKVQICEALIEAGEVVSMSGDGVNDAPALRRAHVGVAMGQRGTDVAREAADIVLADDAFTTIIQAIREGRRIGDNIRRFVVFLLRANFDELLLILTAVALALPLPYLAIHVLWINLLTDGLPALALGVEPAEPDVMQRPPLARDAHILAGQALPLVLATLMGFGVVLGFWYWELEAGVPLERARASTLTLAICFELVQALSSRSRHPIWEIGWNSNPWLSAAIATVLGVHLLVLYTPLHHAFRLVPIDLGDWLRIGGIALASLLLFELTKLANLRWRDPIEPANPR